MCSRLVLISITCMALVGVTRADEYQSFFLYLGDAPKGYEADWTERIQGITHDDTHWIISQKWRLWRVPVHRDLGTIENSNDPDVTVSAHISDIVPLQQGGENYSHFGDITYYRTPFGTAYLIVPVENRENTEKVTGLALFDPVTLTYIAHTTYFFDVDNDGQCESGDYCDQTNSSWAAVAPDGAVFTSNFCDVSRLFRYELDWSAVTTASPVPILSRSQPALYGSDGSPMTLDHVQGGVLTDDGAMLYLVADEIFAFDTSTFRLVGESNNDNRPFKFQWDRSAIIAEEPEGLTLWDLDDTNSPHRGQMHVMLLQKDDLFFDTLDQIYLKHYTHRIRVMPNATGTPDGTPEAPFGTVSGAVDYAWNGAELVMQAGDYAESLIIDKRVRLVSESGLVRIGM